MPSTLGDARRVGPYDILETLGQGAMGEVYLARDSRLSRNVAIKIISAANSDEGRRKRFIQEARSASALNHPNIVTIHDFGTSDGISYIVSELVQGESLRQILRRGPLTMRALLDIALQIADALAAAHDSGIVHRDLKPENIMVTGKGQVKLLDFGLAKAVSGHDQEATVDENLTEPGLIVGTVAYMSPEQARGEPATVQSDQFAFGVILHEMTTGNHPFKRESPMETLLAIAAFHHPPFTPGPVAFRMLVERCLAFEPEKRYAQTSELAERLRKIRRDLPEDPAPKPAKIRWWRRVPPRLVTYALLALAVFALGILVAARALTPSVADPLSFRFIPFAVDSRYATDPAWTSSGAMAAYAAPKDGVMQIFARSLDSPSATQITTAAEDCSSPFWGPHDSRLYYISGRSLWAVNPTGGTPELVQSNVDHAAISPDGKTFAYVRGATVLLGGRKLELPPATEVQFSPDGSRLGAVAGGRLWITAVGEGRPIARFDGVRSFSWMPDGRRVIFSAGHLWAGDTVDGSKQLLTNGTGTETVPSVAPDGRSLLFAQVDARSGLYSIDLSGGSAPAPVSAGFEEAWPAWSPVKTEYAYVAGASGRREIRLCYPGSDWERTIGRGDEFRDLAFGPGGLSIAYVSDGRVEIAPLTGQRPAPVSTADDSQRAPAWSPDGNWIAFFATHGGRRVLEKVRIGSSDAPVILREDDGRATAWSPQGNWIAYAASQPGIVLVSPDGGQNKTVGSGEWLAFTWTQHGSFIAGVKRDSLGLLVAKIDPQSGEEHELKRLPPARGVSGFSIAYDQRTAMLSLNTATSRLWKLDGLQGQKMLLNFPQSVAR